MYESSLSNNNNYKINEFGDYIGGVLNPLFALLSTVAIIYLTYIIAKGDDVKAERAIEMQRRLTINQMRQSAFENLVQKTNHYVYELDKLAIYEAQNNFIQKMLTNTITAENGEKTNAIWFIILSEIENFIQFNYLFTDLFKSEKFKTKHKEIIEITTKLIQEQSDFKFVKTKTLENYIDKQKDYLSCIGEYIYTVF